MEVAKKLKITLVRSTIGKPEDQRRTVKSLGLGKLNSWVIQKDTPDIRGKVKKLEHLLAVEEIDS
ncbi:MAG TPA: 50S ribosomal protein L30 [Clostridia bacterium]|nr:50S ribosomal protein L30 [Clostridia bacterium]